MHQLRLVALGRLKADLCTACLEILEVRAGGNFNIAIVRRHPDLNVVGFGGGEAQIAGRETNHAVRQAQKLQEEMDKTTTELETKEYTATSGGNAVEVVATGKMELKSITIKPEVVDPEDVEMLSDLILAATNEALRTAAADKSERMEALSGGLNVPGIF